MSNYFGLFTLSATCVIVMKTLNIKSQLLTLNTPSEGNYRNEITQWPVFAVVRGPRRARRGDCQEPGTRRDGKT